MKHLIETTSLSSLGKVNYDRIILDSTTNDLIVRGGGNANGHPYVDLGLPSGLKWATMNVGAETETDYGYYFQWGDIEDKSNAECSWVTYKYCNGTEWIITKYCNDSEYGTVDNKTTLDPEDDAATYIMGGDWRMPTRSECQELLDNTNSEWVTINGVNGRKFTSTTDTSKYIFIPAAGIRSGSLFSGQGTDGLIWSSSIFTARDAFDLRVKPDNVKVGGLYRCYGYTVRGVL